MHFYRNILSLVCILSMLTASSCNNNTSDVADGTESGADTTTVSVDLKYDVDIKYDSEDMAAEYDEITDSFVFSDDRDNIFTVTDSGTYVFSGKTSDGRIIVNSPDKGTVRLVFNGIDLTSATSAPVYIIAADKCIITLADGTENTVTDAASYTYDNVEDEEPSAAIFSKDDLIINGNGSLTVNANFNNGIHGKDELKITGGNITVNAVNNAVKGKDCVGIAGGTLNLTAGGNGIISDSTEDSTLGYVVISDGNINVTSDCDGIQAETCLLISGGTVSATSGGGSNNGSTHTDSFGGGMGGFGNIFGGYSSSSSDDTVSTKGIKAGVDISITGGNITVDSADDALHSNSSISLNDGTITLAAGDDAVHADSELNLNGSTLTVSTCYEGLEAATININAGNTHIVSEDDGINASSGNSTNMGGMGGMMSDSSVVNFTGGYVYINAGGDGFDSNGDMNMSDGTLIIDGPTDSGNGAIDYGNQFTMTGGLIVASGSSGMAEAVSESSTQYCLSLTFSSKTSDTLVHIESDDGKSILTYSPSKTYQSVVVCCPKIENGATYNIYTGGTCDGNNTDGLYSDGSYSGGTHEFSITVSSIVTANASNGMGGGMGGGFGGGMGGGFGGGGRR